MPNFSVLLHSKCRSLKIVKKWKMREYHVFFLYYAYFIFSPYLERIPNGRELILAMQNLLLALNLTKGFSSQVGIIVLNYCISWFRKCVGTLSRIFIGFSSIYNCFNIISNQIFAVYLPFLQLNLQHFQKNIS